MSVESVCETCLCLIYLAGVIFVNFNAYISGWGKLPSIFLYSVACLAAFLCAADGGIPGGAKGWFCSMALLSEFLKS